MKCVAIILLGLILFLSTSVDCNDCCPDADAGQEEDCSGTCSPFSTCNACAGFTLHAREEVPASPAGGVSLVVLYPRETYVSPSIAGVWQPPRAA